MYSLISRGLRVALPALILLCTCCSGNSEDKLHEAVQNGNRYFDQKKFAEAIIEYRRALQYDPRAGEARYKLAQAYDQLGDGANAAREYVRAADVLTNNAEAQVRAGVFLLASHRYEDAKARAVKALDVEPKDVEAHMLLAEATAMMNDIDGAVREIEHTMQMEPGDARPYTRLARYQSLQGDVAAAERSFKQAVALEPESLTPTLALARFYLATRRVKEAEEWLTKAQKLSPSDPALNRTLGALYVSSGRTAEAEAPLKRYAESSPSAVGKLTLADYYFSVNRRTDIRRILQPYKSDPDFGGVVLARLAIVEAADGKTSEAFKLLDQAVAKNPNDVEAMVLKGRLLTAQGKGTEAIQVLEQAVAIDRAFAPAHYHLGVAYIGSGDTTRAIDEFKTALKLSPVDPAAKLQLAQLYQSQGNAADALSLASEAVRLQPQNGQARLIAANAMLATGDLTRAESEARQIAAALPKLAEPSILLGRIELRRKNFSAAEQHFQRALQLGGLTTNVLGGLIDARIGAGRTPDAHALIDETIQKAPRRLDVHLLAARLARSEHDDQKFEASLKRVLELDSNNITALTDLSHFYMDRQAYDEARKYLEPIVSRDPKAIWAETLIAISFERQNRKRDARERYERILERDANAPYAANNLAMLYIEGDENLDLALKYAQSAKAAMPNAPQIDDTLGVVYLKKGITELAISSFKSAVAADQKNSEYAYHLGMAYQQKDDKRQARAMFQRALDLSSDFEGAADARARLAAYR